MDRLQFVVKSKVPEDSGAGFIHGANHGPAVESAIRLVEIGRGQNVGGDQFVILADLGNAIHLDSKENRDALFFQLSRKCHRFRCTPAHSVDNDAGVLLFFAREYRIVVGVQESSDFFVCLLPAPILKHFHMNTRGVVFTKTRRELDTAVDEVIVPDESAYETDDDDWLFCRTSRNRREARALILPKSIKTRA